MARARDVQRATARGRWGVGLLQARSPPLTRGVLNWSSSPGLQPLGTTMQNLRLRDALPSVLASAPFTNRPSRSPTRMEGGAAGIV